MKRILSLDGGGIRGAFSLEVLLRIETLLREHFKNPQLVLADHFAAFLLGLELLSVPLYALIAYRCREQDSIEAGLKYLILAGVSTALPHWFTSCVASTEPSPVARS